MNLETVEPVYTHHTSNLIDEKRQAFLCSICDM